MRNISTALLISLLLSGCASFSIDGTVSEVCKPKTMSALSDERENNLAIFGKKPGDFLDSNEMLPFLVSKPAPQNLTNPITRESIATGLRKLEEDNAILKADFTLNSNTQNYRRKLLAKILAEQGETGTPKALDLTTSKVPQSAADAAADARAFLVSFWGDYRGRTDFTKQTGESFSIQAGQSIPSGQTRDRIRTIQASDLVKFSRIENLVHRGGFEALSIHAYGQLGLMRDANSKMTATTADSGFLTVFHEQSKEFSTAAFLSLYFTAYFRGGQVFQSTLNITDLTAKILKQVEDSLPSGSPLTTAQKEALKEDLKKKIPEQLASACKDYTTGTGTCLLTKALGEESFVTRSGLSVQFAGISATVGKEGTTFISATYPSAAEIGPQITRVALEAVFDSLEPRLPAVATSTACKAHALPCIGEKNTAGVNKMDGYGNQVEAVVTSAAGKIIRGVNIVALNNEAIAKSLETFAGVLGRKWFEKATWSMVDSGSCASVFSPAFVEAVL